MSRINRYIWFLIMIIIGVGAGLYYAWYIKPAEFVDAAMYNLRQDYKADYVLMVAEIYDRDHDRYHALVRLDKILAPNETVEEAVQNAIRNAEGFPYDPVDLDKMRRLNEIVTGVRPTPTSQAEITKIAEMTETALAGPASTQAAPLKTATPTPGSGEAVADENPFGTSIQITTDPNAVPMLDLPMMPTITPRGDFDPGTDYSYQDDSWNDDFGNLPGNFFGGF